MQSIEPGQPQRRRPSKAPRVPMREADPRERAKDFRPVGLGYSLDEARAEADRCLQCGRPTCQEGCPVNIDIRGFIGAILDDDLGKGIAIIKERSQLPSVCGRVCPQEKQCEGACVLAKRGVPVAIGNLERFLGDRDMACSPEDKCRPEVLPSSGKQCAVVGAGPAGLACAAELARLGHAVTVFEGLHAPGGVLGYGIPEFRLPEAVVLSEVESLEAMGVEMRYNSIIGRIATVDDLLNRDGYDAVFLGLGAGLPVFLGVPGEGLSGVFAANEYLTRVNLMHAADFPKAATPAWRGSRVIVVGGGNVAMDAARTALRLGATKVMLVYRRTVEEMPARIEEIHHAQEEGVEFLELTAPIAIEGSDGFVTGLRCLAMELGDPDASGRRAPVPVDDSEHIVECDTVVVAVGTRANPLAKHALPDAERNSRGYLAVDEHGATSVEGVWAGGDIVTGAATVILAMGAGRTAAQNMDDWLRS